MHVSNVLHVARWKYRMQKIASLAPSHNFVKLYLRSWGMYWQSEKNLLNTDTSSTCPHNMVRFGLLTAEIPLASLGHHCKFQRLSSLGSVIARHSSSGRHPNFAALNRGRHLYSAGDHHVGHWPTLCSIKIYFSEIFVAVRAIRDPTAKFLVVSGPPGHHGISAYATKVLFQNKWERKA